jgi:hypothetical protein
MTQSLPSKVDSHSPIREISCIFLEIEDSFTTVFTQPHHNSVSWARLNQFAPYFTDIYFNINLPSTAQLPCNLFPSGFPNKILNAYYVSHQTWPPSFNRTDNKELKFRISSYNSIHPSVTSGAGIVQRYSAGIRAG